MNASFWELVASGVALFLIGANLAFLVEFGGRLVTWFQVELASVVGLLIYVATSLVFGQPSWWRIAIGTCALALQLFALFWMWRSVQGEAIGHVPLVITPRDAEENAARPPG